MINRGYSSFSAMHDAFERVFVEIIDEKNCTILYLRDHDPTGLDMIRDIKNRFEEFSITEDLVENLNAKHIALTTEQIYKYQPPENPVKSKDPRARGVY